MLALMHAFLLPMAHCISVVFSEYICLVACMYDRGICSASASAPTDRKQFDISENCAYHHGENSLQGAIVGLAQDFVGSNNLNLLLPKGQFGSRLLGGKDSASPRYIFTELNPIVKRLFPEDDMNILNYLEDDGAPIEPEHYMPIIPMLLVNGSTGIATGYHTMPCRGSRMLEFPGLPNHVGARIRFWEPPSIASRRHGSKHTHPLRTGEGTGQPPIENAYIACCVHVINI